MHIDVHPVDQALTIFYEAEAMIFGESGDAVIKDKKKCQKM